VTVQHLDGLAWEIPTPLPDGATDVFVVVAPYKPGTLSVWHDGVLVGPSLDNGFLETGASSFTMKEPPLAGDVLGCEYEPA